MSSNVGTAIAIMAGGRSRRMGCDKGLLDFNGEPMLERMARVAMQTGRDVVVVGREQPGNWGVDGVQFIADEHPGKGPLGGLATALRNRRAPTLALACDLPLLTGQALLWLLDIWEQEGEGDGLITARNGFCEPLFSVYAVSALSLAETVLRSGAGSLRALQRAGSFATAELPADIAAQLLNVNTPEEFREAGLLRERLSR